MNQFCGPICVAGSIGIVVLCGCGAEDSRPGRVQVRGTVLRMGQPVADATVIFEPVGSTPAASGTTDATGRFVLTTFDVDDGAVPGDYKVAVRKVQVIRGERPANAPDDLATPPPDEKWLLPVKYGNTTSSGFAATVKSGGKNEFKFELPD